MYFLLYIVGFYLIIFCWGFFCLCCWEILVYSFHFLYWLDIKKMLTSQNKLKSVFFASTGTGTERMWECRGAVCGWYLTCSVCSGSCWAECGCCHRTHTQPNIYHFQLLVHPRSDYHLAESWGLWIPEQIWFCSHTSWGTLKLDTSGPLCLDSSHNYFYSTAHLV